MKTQSMVVIVVYLLLVTLAGLFIGRASFVDGKFSLEHPMFFAIWMGIMLGVQISSSSK